MGRAQGGQGPGPGLWPARSRLNLLAGVHADGVGAQADAVEVKSVVGVGGVVVGDIGPGVPVEAGTESVFVGAFRLLVGS